MRGFHRGVQVDANGQVEIRKEEKIGKNLICVSVSAGGLESVLYKGRLKERGRDFSHGVCGLFYLILAFPNFSARGQS
jgi:hypothetical protein